VSGNDSTYKLQPGVTLDVPKYIAGMCEKYDVNIPEN